MMKYLLLGAALLIGGCSGTQQDRQAGADQVFGAVKVGYVIASLAVSVYDQLQPCGMGGAKPPLCYDAAVGRILDKSMQGAALAIKAAEDTFAAANTDQDARLKAANVAKAVLDNLMVALRQYDLLQLSSG